MVEKSCIYKFSCGYDFCMMEDCPEYIEKTENNKYFGMDDEEVEAYMETTEAYKNGYAKGFEDGKQDSGRRGHWIIHSSGNGKDATNWAECSECHVCGSPQWKRCPVCEAKMEV